MGKKLLGILLCLCTGISVPAYAFSVDLSLFSGGLSVLDGLFLIGAGLTLIGVLFLCIALLKNDKEVPVAEVAAEFSLPLEPVEEDEEEVPPVEEPEEEVQETEEGQEEAAEQDETEEEEAADEIENLPEDEETPDAEPVEEEEPEPEKEYPTLTLTGMNNTEFKILPLKESVTLGRRPGNDLIFADTTISGVHCEITVEEDKIYLQDKGSTNGTYLNREKLTEKAEIHKGDILALGRLEFKISI